MRANIHGMAVPLAGSLLPFFTPSEGTRWQGHISNGAPIKSPTINVTAANKAFFAKIDLIDPKIINHHAIRALANKRVKVLVFEKQGRSPTHLIGIAPTGDAFASDRIIRLPDSGEQQ